MLPGAARIDHWRAAQDLREVPQDPNDPVGPNAGSWRRLAALASRAPRAAVLSHELLCAASPEQARRAAESLAGAELHVVLTVRDMGSLLPAEWQETVKHRNGRDWDGWLGDVIDREYPSPERRAWWFWQVHDTAAILEIWRQHVPPERIHVITVPPSGGPRDLLWRRFAGVLGVEPGELGAAVPPSNTSLGLAETELLRKVNHALPPGVPDWFYQRHVKAFVAHDSLATRSGSGRLQLPAARDEWAAAYAEGLVATLARCGYDVVGDLAELHRHPAGHVRARAPGRLRPRAAAGRRRRHHRDAAAAGGRAGGCADGRHGPRPARPRRTAAAPPCPRGRSRWAR